MIAYINDFIEIFAMLNERISYMKNLKKYRLNPVAKFGIKLLFIILIIVAALLFVIQIHRNTGNENSPFVRDGDLCIFNRLATININDVVLYESPNGQLKVGRVVALPSQKVDINDTGTYRVNDYLPEEEITYPTKLPENNKINYPLTLKSNQYFILNDFRTLTSDSREYGVISKSQIHGNLLMLFRRRGF